jgi:hypothetical protein
LGRNTPCFINGIFYLFRSFIMKQLYFKKKFNI